MELKKTPRERERETGESKENAMIAKGIGRERQQGRESERSTVDGKGRGERDKLGVREGKAREGGKEVNRGEMEDRRGRRGKRGE